MDSVRHLNRCAELEIGLEREHRFESSASDLFTAQIRIDLPDSETDDRLHVQGLALDREALRVHEQEPARYGGLLSGLLFGHPDARAAFTRARGAGERLRIRLSFGPGAADLHDLRWETLRDPEQPAAPLLTDPRILFSRYLSAFDSRPREPPPHEALHALVVVADPVGLSDYGLTAIDCEKQLAAARVGLAGLTLTELVSDRNASSPRRASLTNILGALCDRADILYIVCHGRLSPQGHPALFLDDDVGATARVDGAKLVQHIRDLECRPRLVILASCEGAGAGRDRSSSDGALSALGPSIANAGVPAVLAMQGLVRVRTVEQFMPAFFRELMKSGVIDQAVTMARGAISDANEFWRPALFMRLKNGRLWDSANNSGERNTDHRAVNAGELGPQPDHLQARALPPLDPYIIHPTAIYDRFGALGFQGREWLISEIDGFCSSHNSGYFVIEAAAGLGKTAIVAYISRTRRCCHHFFELTPGPSGQIAAVRNVYAQLITLHGLESYSDRVSHLRAEDMFDVLTAVAIAAGGQKVLLAIDGLDEASGHQTINPLGLPKTLPNGIFVIITQRPGPTIKTLSRKEVRKIEQNSAENLRDARAYISQVIATQLNHQAPKSTSDEIVEIILKKSEGVWIYLHFLLLDLEQGTLIISDLSRIPDGIWNYYASFWSTFRVKDIEKWDTLYLPLLGMLGALQEASTFEDICDRAGLKPTSALRETLHVSWAAFFLSTPGSKPPRYAPYHASIKDFLRSTSPTENLESQWQFICHELAGATVNAHKVLADRALRAWGGWESALAGLTAPASRDSDNQYGLRHCHTHLRAIGRTGESTQLLELSHDEPGESRGNTWFIAHDEGCNLPNFTQDHLLVTQSDDAFHLRFRSALAIASQNTRTESLEPMLLPLLVQSGVWTERRLHAHVEEIRDPLAKVTTLMTVAHLDPVRAPLLEDEAITILHAVKDDDIHTLVRGIVRIMSMQATKRALPMQGLLARVLRVEERMAGLLPMWTFSQLAPHLDEHTRAGFGRRIASSWIPAPHHIYSGEARALPWLTDCTRERLFASIIARIDAMPFSLSWFMMFSEVFFRLGPSEQLQLAERHLASSTREIGYSLLSLHDDNVMPVWMIIRRLLERDGEDDDPSESVDDAMLVLLRMKPGVAQAQLRLLPPPYARLVTDRLSALTWTLRSIPPQDARGVDLIRIAALIPCDFDRLLSGKLDETLVSGIEKLLLRDSRGEERLSSSIRECALSALKGRRLNADVIRELLSLNQSARDQTQQFLLIKIFSTPRSHEEVPNELSEILMCIRDGLALPDSFTPATSREEHPVSPESNGDIADDLEVDDVLFVAACREFLWNPDRITRSTFDGFEVGLRWGDARSLQAMAMLAYRATSTRVRADVWSRILDNIRLLIGEGHDYIAVSTMISCAPYVPHGWFVVQMINLLSGLDELQEMVGEVLLALSPRVTGPTAASFFAAAMEGVPASGALVAAACVIDMLPRHRREAAVSRIFEYAAEFPESWDSVITRIVLRRLISRPTLTSASLEDLPQVRGRQVAAAYATVARLGEVEDRHNAWFHALSQLGDDFDVAGVLIPHIIAAREEDIPMISRSLISYLCSAPRQDALRGVLDFVPLLARWMSRDQFLLLGTCIRDVCSWWP